MTGPPSSRLEPPTTPFSTFLSTSFSLTKALYVHVGCGFKRWVSLWPELSGLFRRAQHDYMHTIYHATARCDEGKIGLPSPPSLTNL